MRESTLAIIASIAQHQHGLVACWQLLEAGISTEAVVWARDSGHLRSYRYGVLVVPSAPQHPAQAVLAACLAAGPQAVASHWSAGFLHRLKGVAPGAVEIAAPRDKRRAGVIVHRLSTPLDRRDRCRRDGVPVTSVARTLVDLAGTGRIWLVERALDDAMVRGLCGHTDVTAAIERAGVRPGLTSMRRLVAARFDERVDSHQEIRWLRVIRAWVGVTPVLHHRVSTHLGLFEIDIAFPPFKVGFEVNGWTAHGTRSAFDRDAQKGLALLAEGWHIGTLTSNMTDAAGLEAARALLGRYRQSVGGIDAI